jgi:hypothetical protein
VGHQHGEWEGVADGWRGGRWVSGGRQRSAVEEDDDGLRRASGRLRRRRWRCEAEEAFCMLNVGDRRFLGADLSTVGDPDL